MNPTMLRLGCSLFFKKWWLQLLIMLQIAATLLLTNLLVFQYNDAHQVERLFRGFDGERTWLYMPVDTTAVGEIAGRYGDGMQFETVTTALWSNVGESGCRAVFYGDRTAAGLGLPFDRPLPEGRIPCVASGPFRTGDRIAITYEGQPVELEVVRHLGEKQVYFSFVGSSDEASLDLLCDQTGSVTEPVLLLRKSDLPGVFPQSARANALVFFDGEPDQAAIEAFRDAAWMSSLGSAREKTLDELGLWMKNLLPVALAIFLVGMASLTGLTLLHTLRRLRAFAIFTVCGMSRRQLFGIGTGYALLLLLGTGLLLIPIVLWAAEARILLEGMIVSWLNVLATGLVAALVAVVTAALPPLLIRKEHPLTTLSKGGTWG